MPTHEFSKSQHGITLSKLEFDRIKQSVLPSQETFDYEEKRRNLKKLSNDRMKHWPNTLEATRLRKESFLKEKEQMEEDKRKLTDIEVSY